LIVKDSHVGHTEVPGNLGKTRVVFPRSDADKLKLIRMSGDNTKGGFPDGACGAE
jgi:hypothetical protein